MIKTQVTWNNQSDEPPMSDERRDERNAEINAKLQSYPEPNGEIVLSESGPYVVTRSWTNLADAQDWIDFIAQSRPISAVIITE